MVMLTAEPSPALAEQALSSGLTDFMSKRSLTSEQLRQTLCNAMVKRKVVRSLQSDTEEEGRDPHDSAPDVRQTVIQALSLLDQSVAMKRCIPEDQEAEMAIEMLPEEQQARAVICNAPLVEGAVMGATEAWGGASLEQVRATAEELSPA